MHDYRFHTQVFHRFTNTFDFRTVTCVLMLESFIYITRDMSTDDFEEYKEQNVTFQFHPRVPNHFKIILTFPPRLLPLLFFFSFP